MASTVAQVRQLSGIGEVKGDMGDGSLIVEYDPEQVTPDEIAASINETAFPVEGTFTP